MLVVLVVCGTGIAFAAEGASTTDESSLSAAPEESEGIELPSKRTATSDTYRLPGGELETQLYENPVNYRDGQGDWKPIEEGLQYEGKALTNGANSFDLSLPAKMGAGAVRLSEEGHWVSYKLLGEETQPAELEEGIAGYQAPSGPAFDLSGLANGVKEQIELTDPSQPSSFRFELDASSGLVPSIEADGSLAFRDGEGEVFAALPAPTVTDSSSEAVPNSEAVGYVLQERSEGTWLLTLEVNPEWLSAPEREFPARIDPTLTLESPTLDCTIGSLPTPYGWGECGSNGRQSLLAAYSQKENQPVRSLLKFNVSTIPKTADVTEAKVSLNSPVAAENTSAVQMRRLTRSWTEKLDWKCNEGVFISLGKPFCLHFWSTPGGDYSSEGAEVLTAQRGSGAGLWNFSSPELAQVVQKWVSGATTNQGLLVKNSNESKAECEANPEHCNRRYVEFNSSAAADSHVRPKMYVTYYTAAPSTSKLTSPIEGTVTGKRLKLTSAWSKETAGVTGVTFQYRGPSDKVGESKGSFHTIPTGLVQKANGESVSWPLAVSGVYQTEPVYFNAALADPVLDEKGGEVEVRALFEALGSAAGYSAPVKAKVERFKGGPRDAGAGVGPGSVDLLTGNYTMSDTDVSIPVFGSSLEFARSWSTAESVAGKSGVLGPGWAPSAPVEAAGGSEWQSIKEVLPSAAEIQEYQEFGEAVPPGYVLLTDLEGDEIAFEISGSGGFVVPPEMSGWQLSRPGGNQIALTDSAGNRTLFEKQEGSNEYKPVSITETGGGANSTQMVYEFPSGGNKRLKMVIGPHASGIECVDPTAIESIGCRVLKFNYQSFGFGERLTSITYYGPANASSMGSWEVARYGYEPKGRLSEEWDPRISPALKETYVYGSGGELTTITPPGEEPWTLEYSSVWAWGGETPQPHEPSYPRLVAALRSTLLAIPAFARTTIVYGVPLSEALGGPYNMSPSAVAQWGQQETPTDATAIFPPDQEPASPPSSYSHATLYYMDAEGQTVNTATPSGAGTSAPSTTTSEYDEYGNVVRELSAQNLLRVLKQSSEEKRLAKAKELETKRIYNSEGTEKGTEMREEWGPMHEVRLESGEVAQARFHKVVEYDKNEPTPPSGTPYAHLPTLETTGASIPGKGTDADQRATETAYNWTLRKPTDTFVDPNGLNLHTHIEYDSETGLPTETRLPANPEGGDAHTTKTIYYIAGHPGRYKNYPSCEDHSAWANLPCVIVPAAQPGTSGQPNLLSKEVASYNQLGQPTEVVESAGEIDRNNARITHVAYDAAGRPLTKSQTGGGTSLPETQTVYNTANGKPEAQRFVCSSCDTQEVKTIYDALGRVTEYQDADGNTAKTTYDLDGRPLTTSDGKGTQTRTYDPTSGLLVKLEDSAAGTFTAAYNADGSMVEEGLPDGLVAKTTYDKTGAPTNLSYEKTTFCSTGCTWLEYGLERSITGQILKETTLTSTRAYSYDKAGRLELAEETPTGGECTTRSYSYDKDSNRTALVTRTPGIGGVCDTSSKGTTQSYGYDAGDRLTTPSGIVYDNYGRITSLPGEDAGGGTLTTSYYSNEQIAIQSQGGISNSYQLDATGRERERVQTGGSEPGTEIYHYAGGSDSPIWTETSSGWTRQIPGIGGSLAAIQSSTKGTTLQLTDPHGDVAATASLNPEATKLLATYEFDEFGNPKQSATPQYGWLGGKGRRTQLPSGVIQMGVRSYIPEIGRFISPDPVPGGSANAYDYAGQDPVNAFDLNGESKTYDAPRTAAEIRERNRRVAREHNFRPFVNRGCSNRGCVTRDFAHVAGVSFGDVFGHVLHKVLGVLTATNPSVNHESTWHQVKTVVGYAVQGYSSEVGKRAVGCAASAFSGWLQTQELAATGPVGEVASWGWAATQCGVALSR